MRAGMLIAALLLSSLVFTACVDQMTEVPNFRRVPTSEERSYVIGPAEQAALYAAWTAGLYHVPASGKTSRFPGSSVSGRMGRSPFP